MNPFATEGGAVGPGLDADAVLAAVEEGALVCDVAGEEDLAAFAVEATCGVAGSFVWLLEGDVGDGWRRGR